MNLASRTWRSFAACALLLCGAAVLARAQDDYPAKVLAVEVTPKTALPGSHVTVRVDVQVAEGWHVYGLKSPGGIPTAFEPPAGGWPKDVAPTEPAEAPPPRDETVGG